MKLKEYQKFCLTTDLFPPVDMTPRKKVDLLEYRTLGLCGEAGEFSEKILELLITTLGGTAKIMKLGDKVKKIRRDDGFVTGTKQNEILSEIGDIFWYLASICNILHVDMDLVLKNNVKKLSKRKDEGKIRGDGDHR